MAEMELHLLRTFGEGEYFIDLNIEAYRRSGARTACWWVFDVENSGWVKLPIPSKLKGKG